VIRVVLWALLLGQPTLMGESRIQAIEHVNLEAPLGIDEAMRWFYGRIVGLVEIECAQDGGCMLGFKSERIELRIRLAAEPLISSTPLRLTVKVLSLDEVAEGLDQRRRGYTFYRGLMYSDRRIETLDPAGHRVALKRHWPIGPM